MSCKESICTKKKLLAILTAMTLVLSGIPFSFLSLSENVYAGGESPATSAEAAAALKAAKDEEAAARQEKDQAQEVYDSADSEYKAAKEISDNKKDIFDQKQDDYDSAIAAREDAEEAKESAEAAVQNAQTAYDAAVKTSEEKNAAAESAEKACAAAEMIKLLCQIEWASDKETAQAALENAQSDYDNLGVDFLNEKAGESLTDSVWYSWLKRNMKNKSFPSSNPQIAWNDVLDTNDFNAALYSPYSYSNLIRAADLVDEGNVLRKSQDSSLSNIKISYKIMTQAIASNALSSFVVGHVLMNDSDYKSSELYTACGYAGWENISWGAADPFMGWYYEEKIHYLADKNGENKKNITAAMVTQIIEEATSNGHDFLGYCKYYRMGNNASEIAEYLNDDRPAGSYSTGHYTNLINSGHKATGLSFNSKGQIYGGICHVQDFGQTEMSDAVTPEVFRNELNTFKKTYEKNLNDAQAKVDDLAEEPDYLKTASSNLDDAETLLSNANREKASAEAAKNSAEEALENAKKDLETAKTACTNAASQMQTAIEEFNAAQADYQNAKSTTDQKEGEKNSAQTVLDQKEKALNEASAKVDAAQAAYDEFFKDDEEQKDPSHGGQNGGQQKKPAKITVGSRQSVAGNEYRVSAVAGAGSGKVIFTRAKNAGSVVVPGAVKLADGKAYKVTMIASGAFKGRITKTATIGKNIAKMAPRAFSASRVSKLIVKTRLLTKKSVKGSLKGSKVKTVKVKVGSKKMNKKFVRKYKKIFKKKNAGKKVKVK